MRCGVDTPTDEALPALSPDFHHNRTHPTLTQQKQPHYLGAMQMRDEVREVRPGLYLGLGAFGLRDARRVQPLPFLLRGPFNQLTPAEARGLGLRGAEAVLARAGGQPPSDQGTTLPPVDEEQQRQQQPQQPQQLGGL